MKQPVLSASMTVDEACDRVLRKRLRQVGKRLPKAARADASKPEAVHRLRTTARRAETAVRAFAPFLGSSKVRRARRVLRAVRRSAGDARGCDVHKAMLLALRDERSAAEQRAIDLVVEQLDTERDAARRALRRAAKRYTPADLRQDVIRPLRKSIKGKRARGIAVSELAADAMDRLVATVAEAASADLSSLDQLHALRIRVKRLRYAVELFRPALTEAQRAAWGDLKSMQDRLGAINDAGEFTARLEALRDAPMIAGAAQRDPALNAALATLVEVFRCRRDDVAQAFRAERHSGALQRPLAVLRGDGGVGRAETPTSPTERTGATDAADAAQPHAADDDNRRAGRGDGRPAPPGDRRCSRIATTLDPSRVPGGRA